MVKIKKHKQYKGCKAKKTVKTVITQLILIIMAFLAVFPFLWMISTSLKGAEEVFSYPPKLIPEVFHWENYKKALTDLPFDKAYWNSIKLAVINVTGQVVTSAMAGYALGKLKFRGSKIVFGGFIGVMMVPYTVISIPLFLIFSELNLIDTHLSIILMTFAYMPMGVFLCRQFIMAMGKPKAVNGYVANVSHQNVEGYTVEDTSVSNICFESGALGSITGSNCAVKNQWNGRFRIICENMVADFEDQNHAKFTFTNEDKLRVENIIEDVDCTYAEDCYFIETVRGNRKPLADIREGYQGLQLVNAVVSSSQNDGSTIVI